MTLHPVGSRIRETARAEVVSEDHSEGLDLTDLEAAAERLREHHPAKAITRVLAEARDRLGMDVAFVSHFSDGQRVFRYLDGDVTSMGLEIGASDPLEASYCARIVAGEAPELMRDAQEEPSVADIPATRELGIGAHVSVPIVFSDGHLYGTFCCFSRSPDDSLDERDISMMRALATLVADQLEVEEMQQREQDRAAARVRSVLSDDGLRTVLQPVVSLSDRCVTFVEALSRFDTTPYRTPDRWFADGWTCGLGIELELKAVRTALETLDQLPADVNLSFNISPETALSSELLDIFETSDPSRLIVEVTEHSEVLDYSPLKRALLELRAAGVSLAVDDVGAGHSGLHRLLELQPEILKLDITMTAGVHRDEIRRALARAIASFARASGLSTVAEGIETPQEVEVLRELGIDCGQGYHFSRPLPVSELRF